MYIFHELPIPESFHFHDAVATHINARGDIVGEPYWSPDGRVVQWIDGTPEIILGTGYPVTKDYVGAKVWAMNDAGHVAGTLFTSDWVGAFYYDRSEITRLYCTDEGEGFIAQRRVSAMNNAAQVVGTCGENQKAVLWTETTLTELPGWRVTDINQKGQILGNLQSNDETEPQNYLLSEGEMTTFGDRGDIALWLSEDGLIVGYRVISTSPSSTVGIAWNEDGLYRITPLEGYSDVGVGPMVTRNLMLGSSRCIPYDACTSRLTVWIDGEPHDLLNVTFGPVQVRLFEAYGINVHGHIVGIAADFLTNNWVPFLLLRVESLQAFEDFPPCLRGPNIPNAGKIRCLPFDRTLDGMIDLRDYAAIQNNFR